MKELKFNEEETKPVENLERDVFNNVIGNQNSSGHGFVVENPRTGEDILLIQTFLRAPIGLVCMVFRMTYLHQSKLKNIIQLH